MNRNAYVVARISDILSNPIVNWEKKEYDTKEAAIAAIPNRQSPKEQYLVVLKENINPNTNIAEKTKIVYVNQ